MAGRQGGAPAPRTGANAAPLPELPTVSMRDTGSGYRSRASTENKRINALNLEPTLPKPGDLNVASQNKARVGGAKPDIKEEFQRSLATLQLRDQRKAGGR